MKIAIVPCKGLGDGLIACVLANNLISIGHQVDVFHPLLFQMGSLFPGFTFFPRPEREEIFEKYDKLLFFLEKLPWMQKMLKAYPEKNIILNPIATPNCDYIYWEEGEFDGTIPFVDNLVRYAEKKWNVTNPTKNNGIALPKDIVIGKYQKRVILHPTSSRAGKNWSKEKYLKLAKKLRRSKFEPIFILSKEEQKDWPEVEAPEFQSLYDLTGFIAESGFMVGNDSGIGHLASCVGIPTLTVCRNKMAADFWRPAWAKGEVVIPPRWIPNIKGMRWRDNKWQKFVSVERVYQIFSSLSHLL